MKVTITEDPSKIYVRNGYYYRAPGSNEEKWVEGDCMILKEDIENAKAFARELMKEDDLRIIRKWEMDYFKQVRDQYSNQVAGALLMMVWDWTKEKYLTTDGSNAWGHDEMLAIADKIKRRVMEGMKNE